MVSSALVGADRWSALLLLLLPRANPPRSQGDGKAAGAGRGRTVRGMDAAAEPTGTYLRRVLPRPAPAAPPDTRQAQRFPQHTHPFIKTH
ncbi:hypothetical protein BN126370013 [Stenotrophomonas thermophila]|nr:hypothetical protein BN126370013 [Stenotrophomonas maltophilia]